MRGGPYRCRPRQREHGHHASQRHLDSADQGLLRPRLPWLAAALLHEQEAAVISSRSRYVDGHVVPEPDATVMVTRVFPTNPGVVAGKSYIWVQGDRLDRLAARWLGSPLLWWKIMDV